jgi:hypothetical protein
MISTTRMDWRSKHVPRRLWQWLLPMALSLALVLSISMPMDSMAHASLSSQHSGEAMVMPGHDMGGYHMLGDDVPVKKASPDQKLHPPCNPGAGCFSFTLSEPPAEMLRQTVAPVYASSVPLLTARSTIPPLPPPIFDIIA